MLTRAQAPSGGSVSTYPPSAAFEQAHWAPPSPMPVGSRLVSVTTSVYPTFQSPPRFEEPQEILGEALGRDVEAEEESAQLEKCQAKGLKKGSGDRGSVDDESRNRGFWESKLWWRENDAGVEEEEAEIEEQEEQEEESDVEYESVAESVTLSPANKRRDEVAKPRPWR